MMGPAEQPPYQPHQEPQRQTFALPSYRSWLVWVLLVANIAVYILMRRAELPGESFDDLVRRFGAKDGPAIDAGAYWRLLTPMVLHGGAAHLLFNSWALYSLGRDSEGIFGTARFAAIYLVAGLMGSLFSYAFNPLALSVGASGAIFGLIGALGAFFWQARDTLGETSKSQLQQIAWLAGINLLIGFSLPNIDNLAHIGGLIGGTLAGLALAPRFEVAVSPLLVEVRRHVSGPRGWLLVLGLLLLIAGGTLAAQALHLSS